MSVRTSVVHQSRLVFQGASVCISTLTLAAISFDRYILIIHPARRAIGLQTALLIVASTWIGMWFVQNDIIIMIMNHDHHHQSSLSPGVDAGKIFVGVCAPSERKYVATTH